MAFKQYKGDRMPSALSQKNLKGELGEDMNLTYQDVYKSRLDQLNKMSEFDLAPGETPQDWMKGKMDATVDSLNTEQVKHLENLRNLYSKGKISGEDAKKRKKKINYDFKKQDKYLAD